MALSSSGPLGNKATARAEQLRRDLDGMGLWEETLYLAMGRERLREFARSLCEHSGVKYTDR